MIRAAVLHRLERSCPECRYEIGQVGLDVLGGRISARGIHVRGKPTASPTYEFRAESVALALSPASFRERALDVRKLEIDGLDFTLIGSSGSRGHGGHHEPWQNHLPAARVQSTVVRGGRFTYLRRQEGREARLPFHAIDLEAGEFGTRSRISPAAVHVIARGQSKGGGRVEIDARLGLHEAGRSDLFRIHVQGVELADINSFFLPYEGLRLKGRLEEGEAHLDREGRRLRGDVAIAYRGLEVQFEPGRGGESPIGALLKQVVASAKVKKSDEHPGAFALRAHVAREQKPDQGVVSLLLDGLKGAVEQIVTG